MSMNAKQLEQYVIVPTLKRINLYSESAKNLLLGTCAQESHMGTYLKQVNGPALGIYQIEPGTHKDVWDNFLRYRPELSGTLRAIAEKEDESLITNLAYATAIARIIYLRVDSPIPSCYDIPGLAKYWKTFYNTPKGKGTVEEFELNYKKYIYGNR